MKQIRITIVGDQEQISTATPESIAAYVADKLHDMPGLRNLLVRIVVHVDAVEVANPKYLAD